MNLETLPRRSVQPSEEIEFRIIGFNLRVLTFKKIRGGVLGPDDYHTSACLLVYEYCRLGHSSPLICPVLLTGGKPQVFFLYEDQLHPDSTIKEYKLSRLRGRPALVLTCDDAENDPERAPPNSTTE